MHLQGNCTVSILCVGDALSLECGCNFVEDSFLISDAVVELLSGLGLLPFVPLRPKYGPLGILEFTTLADAILTLLLLPGQSSHFSNMSDA